MLGGSEKAISPASPSPSHKLPGLTLTEFGEFQKTAWPEEVWIEHPVIGLKNKPWRGKKPWMGWGESRAHQTPATAGGEGAGRAEVVSRFLPKKPCSNPEKLKEFRIQHSPHCKPFALCALPSILFLPHFPSACPLPSSHPAPQPQIILFVWNSCNSLLLTDSSTYSVDFSVCSTVLRRLTISVLCVLPAGQTERDPAQTLDLLGPAYNPHQLCWD